MAIQFARMQYVKRSAGQNVCHKGAYNARMRIKCDRTAEVYNFSAKKDLAYHEIMVPEGAPEDLIKLDVLWNRVESRELRRDAQVAKEMVLALPDNEQVSLEHKIEMVKGFVEEHFVKKGILSVSWTYIDRIMEKIATGMPIF